jgi:hypothetical protein
MLLVTTRVSIHFYAFQNTVLFSVICNAVELYPETDNILGICSVFVSDTSAAFNYPESKSGIEKNSCQFVKLDFLKIRKWCKFDVWQLSILASYCPRNPDCLYVR